MHQKLPGEKKVSVSESEWGALVEIYPTRWMEKVTNWKEPPYYLASLQSSSSRINIRTLAQMNFVVSPAFPKASSTYRSHQVDVCSHSNVKKKHKINHRNEHFTRSSSHPRRLLTISTMKARMVTQTHWIILSTCIQLIWFTDCYCFMQIYFAAVFFSL